MATTLPRCEDCQATNATDVDTARDLFLCLPCLLAGRPTCKGCESASPALEGGLCQGCARYGLPGQETYLQVERWDAHKGRWRHYRLILDRVSRRYEDHCETDETGIEIPNP